jgi:hypothetical protein
MASRAKARQEEEDLKRALKTEKLDKKSLSQLYNQSAIQSVHSFRMSLF